MRPTVLAIVGYIAAGLVMSALFGPLWGWGFVAAAAMAAMLFSRPDLLLALYWLAVSLRDYLTTTVVRFQLLDFLDEVFIVTFAGMALVSRILGRPRRDANLRWVNRFLFALLFLAGASTLLNRAAYKGAFSFLLTYLGFFATFYVAYDALRDRPRAARWIWRIVVGFLLVQLVANLGWLAGLNPLPNWRLGTLDFAIGLCGNSVYLAHLAVLVAFFAFSLFRHSGGAPRRWRFLIVVPIAAVQLVLAYANHAFIVAGALLLIYVTLATHRLRYLLSSLAVCAVLFVGLQSLDAAGLLSDNPIRRLSGDNLRSRWQSMVYGPKGEIARNVFLIAPREIPCFMLVGAGPGNFGSSVAQESHPPLAAKYINYIRETWSGRRSLFGSSILQHYITGVLAIYSELGPLGALLFFGFHLYALFRVLRRLHRNAYPLVFQRALAEVFVLAMCQYLVMNLLTDLLNADIWQAPLWIVAAVVWNPIGAEQAQSAAVPVEPETAPEPQPLAAASRHD